MGSVCPVSSDFWENFVQEYWEKQPVVLQQPFQHQFVTANRIFQALVAASDDYRAGNRNVMQRFYVAGTRQEVELDKYLPQGNDRSSSGYGNRMTKQLNDQEFGLVAHSVQVYDALLWMQIRDFLSGLYKLIGLPASRTDADVFLGNYQVTPFGLHKDTAGTFTFVLEGQKRMVVWPYEVFKDKANRPDGLRHEVSLSGLDYEHFRDQAIVLEGNVGDVIYWPSTYWHVGESDGRLHFSLNVSLYFPWQPLSFISVIIKKMLEERLGPSAWADTYPFDPQAIPVSTQSLPSEIAATLNALREVANDPELQRTVYISWLNRTTACGFTNVPAPLEWKALDDYDVLQVDSRCPIICTLCTNDEMICSVNGHSFAIPSHPKLHKLIQRLNMGVSLTVKNIIDESSVEPSAESEEFDLSSQGLKSLLEHLIRLRAITTQSHQ